MSDNVKNPSYYNRGKIEVWEFIEDQGLDYHTGNAVKYIARAGYKDPMKEVEDLQKAIAFLERKIQVLNGTTSNTSTADTTDTNTILVTFGDYGRTLTANQYDFLKRKFNMSVLMVSTAIEEYKKNKSEYLEKQCVKWFFSMCVYANLIVGEEVVQRVRDFHKELQELEILE